MSAYVNKWFFLFNDWFKKMQSLKETLIHSIFFIATNFQFFYVTFFNLFLIIDLSLSLKILPRLSIDKFLFIRLLTWNFFLWSQFFDKTYRRSNMKIYRAYFSVTEFECLT